MCTQASSNISNTLQHTATHCNRYANGLQLFHELKELVQRKMDVYASICEYIYSIKLASDPNGMKLMSLPSISLSSSITRQV